MSHPYTPLQSMIDAADKAESYLLRHCNPPSDSWERQSWDSLRADRRRIKVIEAVWDRWQAYCARLAGDTSFDVADRRAKEAIKKAVADGFPMARVDAIGNEIIAWVSRPR